MGWTAERYRNSTIDEFNKASLGYWRNWERSTGLLIREIVFELINGNPYYKNKPTHKDQILKLSIDKEPEILDLKEVKKFDDKLKK